MEEVARSLQVVSEGTNMSHPAPCEFGLIDPYDDESVTLRTPGLALWFECHVLGPPGDQIARYANDGGFLPGCIHFNNLRSRCWRNQFSVRDDDTVRHRDRFPSSMRQDFMAAFHVSLRRMFEVDPIPANLDLQMMIYCTWAEIPCVENLLAISVAQIDEWSNVSGVQQASLCFLELLLKCDFRYHAKLGRYWTPLDHSERLPRIRYGQPVPYQCSQVEMLIRDARRRAFLCVP